MSRYLRPIRDGEYDLVNISNVGFDPLTGRSFEECHAEWSQARVAVTRELERTRWWQIWERQRIGRLLTALQSHMGM